MDFRFSEEQELFRKSVRDFVNRELPKSWARELEKDEHEFPHELFHKLADAGFHGIGIDEEYGGQGGDIMTQMILARELARSLGRPDLGVGYHLVRRRQVDRPLRHRRAEAAASCPRSRPGEQKWAIGFTEPGGGTDVLGALRTIATRADGGWIVNGNKTWCSMAHVADYILLLARTDQGRGEAPPGRVPVPAARPPRRA